jgi:glycosyltransferase involved in cell wall biosynthesis
MNVYRIAFFVGSNVHFNVRRVAANFGWMLGDRFELDLVTTVPDRFDSEVHDAYRIYGGDRKATGRGQLSALRDYLSANEPTVLTHFTRPSLHGNLVSLHAARHGVPFLYRYSGDIFYYYNGLRGLKKAAVFGARNVAGRLPLKFASSYGVLGPTGAERLTRRGVDPAAINTLPPSIDGTRFREPTEVPDEVAAHPDRKVVLFVGRRTHMKGIDVFDEAIPELLERREDLQFVFVGGGDRLPDVGPYDDHVTVVGRVVPRRIPAYLHAASCLALPSRSEGIPRAILEALTSGTPVVARDVGDVASVTDNVFRSRSEFVDLLSEVESLPVDDAGWFQRDALKNPYRATFEKICRHACD